MTLRPNSCLLQPQSGLDDAKPLPLEEAFGATVLLDTFAMEAAETVAGVASPPIYRTYQATAATRRDRTKADISSIVLHTPEGGESGTLSVLSGGRAGFDYFLPPNGRLYKCNDFYKYIAWQAGDWAYNQKSIGIEQWDFAANMHNAPDAHYDKLARLCAYLAATLEIKVQHAKSYGGYGFIYHRTITPNDRCDPDACGRSAFKIDKLLDLTLTYMRGGANPTPPPVQSVWHRVSVTSQQVAAMRDKKIADDLVADLKSLGVSSAKITSGP